ncbi:MAG: exodeoxyribonuclease VII small subunit [Clostridia bacterium]|nr:exodeoxyribonuclease VII small subunit [Clostridia bacterium]
MENKELSFEAALARLEQIVSLLEGGKAQLEESLSLFEEGVGLVKLCNSKLDGAEQKVKVLATGEDGLVEKDFSVADVQ